MLALRQARRPAAQCLQRCRRALTTYADLTTQSYVAGTNISFAIPLPSRPGLTTVSAAMSDNVKDLVAQIKTLDPR
jgi:hypothetical protein